MRILVDENIPLMTIQALRDLGHDVLDIRGTTDQGMIDGILWDMAQREGRLLITTDKGFSQHRDELHHGVLIVTLKQPNRRKIHWRAMKAIAQFGTDEWPGLLVTMRDRVQSVWQARGAG